MDKTGNNKGKTEIEHLLQRVPPHLPAPEGAALLQQLTNAVAYLIVHDLERLVRLLYTVDVDEKHLKSLLQLQPGEDAAEIIATLLLERQMQKALTRQQFGHRAVEDEGEERW